MQSLVADVYQLRGLELAKVGEKHLWLRDRGLQTLEGQHLRLLNLNRTNCPFVG